MATPQLAILLSTYNGETYLAEHLDSLLDQSMHEFVLVVRDDGSQDGTWEILQDYAGRYPQKINLVPGNNTNLGASNSFSVLMEYVLQHKAALGLEKAYMMFCDQDDVWRRDKIELQWRAMQQCEQDHAEQPVLIHSDLAVVSADGDLMAESMAHYQGLETERNRFHHVVLSNLVTGCTAFFNEALARRASPIAGDATMHDWWLALVATAFGRVHYMEQSLVQYRQHGANVIGAREKIPDGLRDKSFWKRVVQPGANPHLAEVARQAGVFRRYFGNQLGVRQRTSLIAAACLAVRVGVIQRLLFKLLRKF
ncbi:MAG: glycosyltransferase family 2 protein [Gammaproteobacteria bacterium]